MTIPTDAELMGEYDRVYNSTRTWDRHLIALRAVIAKWGTPQPTQVQAGAVPLTADDLKQPRNGKQWRVEWWNESCRMLLPVDKNLDSFQSYRNGTLMFTIKGKPGIEGVKHGT